MAKYYNGMPVQGPADKPKRQYTMFEDNSDTWDKALDSEALAVLMKEYRERLSPEAMKAGYLPSFYKRVDKEYGGNYQKYVEDVWNNTILMKNGVKIPVRMTRKMKKDMGIELSTSLVETLADIKLVLDSGYYTTAQSLAEKMLRGGEIKDYYVEPNIRSIIDTKNFGIFTDEVSKTLNLCFLSGNDITGGNSGSPIIDGHGRLIGLAFDGNWDSLSDDIYFDASLARTINVDIRYVLYLMKQWGNAPHLLREMGIE